MAIPGPQLELPTGRLGAVRLADRIEAVREAVAWPSGSSDEQAFTRLYAVGGLHIVVGKPGKEAAPDRKRVNVNDMSPMILDASGEALSIPRSFGGMWATFEELSRLGARASLKLCGQLLYRNAYFLDHVRDEKGRFRYRPEPQSFQQLADVAVPPLFIRPDVLMCYLEVVALNEDVKYWTLRKEDGSKYDLKRNGRTANLMTTLHFILALLGQRTLGEFTDAMSRGRGVAPVSPNAAREMLLEA